MVERQLAAETNYSEETCPYILHPPQIPCHLSLNVVCHVGKPVTKYRSYGSYARIHIFLMCIWCRPGLSVVFVQSVFFYHTVLNVLIMCYLFRTFTP
jgi:hypothetical protein